MQSETSNSLNPTPQPQSHSTINIDAEASNAVSGEDASRQEKHSVENSTEQNLENEAIENSKVTSIESSTSSTPGSSESETMNSHPSKYAGHDRKEKGITDAESVMVVHSMPQEERLKGEEQATVPQHLSTTSADENRMANRQFKAMELNEKLVEQNIRMAEQNIKMTEQNAKLVDKMVSALEHRNTVQPNSVMTSSNTQNSASLNHNSQSIFSIKSQGLYTESQHNKVLFSDTLSGQASPSVVLKHPSGGSQSIFAIKSQSLYSENKTESTSQQEVTGVPGGSGVLKSNTKSIFSIKSQNAFVDSKYHQSSTSALAGDDGVNTNKTVSASTPGLFSTKSQRAFGHGNLPTFNKKSASSAQRKPSIFSIKAKGALSENEHNKSIFSKPDNEYHTTANNENEKTLTRTDTRNSDSGFSFKRAQSILKIKSKGAFANRNATEEYTKANSSYEGHEGNNSNSTSKASLIEPSLGCKPENDTTLTLNAELTDTIDKFESKGNKETTAQMVLSDAVDGTKVTGATDHLKSENVGLIKSIEHSNDCEVAETNSEARYPATTLPTVELSTPGIHVNTTEEAQVTKTPSKGPARRSVNRKPVGAGNVTSKPVADDSAVEP